MKLSNGVASNLWLASFRYYLGRMTASVHSFGSMLENSWEDIDSQTKHIIVKELRDAVERDNEDRARGSEYKHLGMNMDSNMWRQLLTKFTGEAVL